MPTIVEQLQALDLSQIDDALGRVRLSVSADGELDLTALDVPSLLGDVAPLIDTVRELESDPDTLMRLARSALGELADLVDLPEVELFDALRAGLDQLVGLLGELAAVLSADDGNLVDRLLTGVGGNLALHDLIGDLAGRAADALAVDLPEPAAGALNGLARLAGDAPAPDELARIVLDAFAGLDLDVVAHLSAELDAAMTIVARAGDTARIEQVLGEIDTQIDTAITLTGAAETAGGSVDGLVATLEDLDASLDRLVAIDLPRLVNGIAADLRSAGNRFVEADLTGHLEQLREQIPRPSLDVVEVLVEPLRDLAGSVDEITGERIAAAMDAARAELTAALEDSPVSELLGGIDQAQEQVVELIRSLPFAALRDELIDALRAVQHEVLAFDGLSFLDQLTTPIRQLIRELEQFDASAITGAVQDLAAMVDGAFADFPIEDLRDAIEAVIDPLGGILGEAGPLLQELTAQLDALAAELSRIDFAAAGTEVREALAGLRQQVQLAVRSGLVPEALEMAIAGAASVLKQMDLSAEITVPFDAAIGVFDVDMLLAPVSEVWDELRATLLRATPDALVAELDPPFDELLARLDDISLEPLVDALSERFGELRTTLHRLDPRGLVAPLEAEFQQLVATVRGLLDPAPLFAPLTAAYGQLQEALASIDAETIVRQLLGGIADTPSRVADTMQRELSDRQVGAGVLPDAGQADFAFGDVLRPLAGLVAEIRGRMHALAGGVVGEGLGLVADATRGLRSAIDPVAGVAVRLADHLDERRAWFDATEGHGPLAETAARLAGLQQALVALDVDAAARARLDTAVGTVSLDARLELDANVSAPAAAAMDRTRREVVAGGAGRSMRLLARDLDHLLPGPLLAATLDPRGETAAFVDALFDAIDPAPLVEELDELGAQITGRLAEFVDELSVGLLRLLNDLFAALDPLMPTNVSARIQAIVDAIAQELTVLDPGVVEEEVTRVIETTVSLLSLHSPATVAAELGEVFDAALAVVDQFDPAELLGGLDPLAQIRADLATLRPSVVLAPLVHRARALTAALEMVASVDLDVLGELVAEVEGSFRVVLEGVGREWDALLDELSQIGGQAEVSESAGVG
jgi:hypothetical protein